MAPQPAANSSTKIQNDQFARGDAAKIRIVQQRNTVMQRAVDVELAADWRDEDAQKVVNAMLRLVCVFAPRVRSMMIVLMLTYIVGLGSVWKAVGKFEMKMAL